MCFPGCSEVNNRNVLEVDSYFGKGREAKIWKELGGVHFVWIIYANFDFTLRLLPLYHAQIWIDVWQIVTWFMLFNVAENCLNKPTVGERGDLVFNLELHNTGFSFICKFFLLFFILGPFGACGLMFISTLPLYSTRQIKALISPCIWQIILAVVVRVESITYLLHNIKVICTEMATSLQTADLMHFHKKHMKCS